jgi:hypothetical protein
MVTNFSTTGGVVTKGDTYGKLMYHLREAEDCAYVLSHLHKTEQTAKDDILAMGWRTVGENLKMIGKFITNLAKKRMQ